MRKNKHDLTHREDADPVAKLSYWSGLLSIPSSFFLLGIPLGLIARIMGGKVLTRSENIPTNSQSWGKAKLGRSFGCAGIILSVVWGLILIGTAIVGAISSLLNAIFK
jgi:hypothetical protein